MNFDLYKNDEKINLRLWRWRLSKEAYKNYSQFKNISFTGYLNNPWKIVEGNGIIIAPSFEEPGCS